jgi:aminopeptidase YwaD
MRTRRYPLFLLLFAIAAPLNAAPGDTSRNPEITPEEVREHIRYLASPELEGRGSGTEGGRKAAQYIARQFREAGLKPKGKRGYFQPFQITAASKMGEPNRVSLRAAGEEQSLKLRDDFLPLAFTANGRASGEVVFVGYGISAPPLNYDDYAGVDVKGRIVLILRQTPDGREPNSRFSPYAPLRSKAMTAREKGAAGILFVTGPLTEGREDLGGFRNDASFSDSGIPAVVVKRAFADRLLATAGKTLQDLQTAIAHGGPSSLPLPGTMARLHCTVVRQRLQTENVLGFLEGSDPRLREEVVVIGAHYDHLGMGGEGSRDRGGAPAIHHGADDNASGTAGLMELAEHFGARKPRPKRSLLFAAFSGEELGLLGSAHYVKEPPVPLARTVAMVNMDMIGRSRGNALTVIGAGTSPQWEQILESANAPFQFDLRRNASGFGASDQTSFYAKDIPVLFFFTGVHADYHRPSDTWEKINIHGQARIVQLVAATLDRIADLPDRPQFVRAEGSGPQMASASGGFSVYLGTIPDYSAEREGVTLSGVREGSPAEKAGLKSGDVIVQFGGKAIKNVYDFTYALRDAKAGEPIEIVILRGADRHTLKITPEPRRS